MTDKTTEKMVDKILSSKQKFRRAMTLIITIGVIAGAVICYGFYTGQIPAIISAFGK